MNDQVLMSTMFPKKRTSDSKKKNIKENQLKSFVEANNIANKENLNFLQQDSDSKVLPSITIESIWLMIFSICLSSELVNLLVKLTHAVVKSIN